MTAKPRVLLIVLVAGLSLCPVSSRAWADGGALRLSERAGLYHIAVFTAPTPVQAGMVDISVFVQDGATGEGVPAALVIVRLKSRTSGEVLEYPASSAAATNKLFQAAVFPLPEAGWWDVEVVVEGPRGQARVRFEMEASRATPRWLTMWPWFTWPILPIALFCLHSLVVRRRDRRPTGIHEERPFPVPSIRG
jgi:hypothetical protein